MHALCCALATYAHSAKPLKATLYFASDATLGREWCRPAADTCCSVYTLIRREATRLDCGPRNVWLATLQLGRSHAAAGWKPCSPSNQQLQPLRPNVTLLGRRQYAQVRHVESARLRLASTFYRCIILDLHFVVASAMHTTPREEGDDHVKTASSSRVPISR